MKKQHILYGLAIALSFGLTSCDNDLAEPPVPMPEGGRVGTGEWNDPMTAYQVRIGAVNDTIATPWVTGYIVGYINTEVSNTLTEASFGTVSDTNPCTVASNLLIATEPDMTAADWEKCASVQLPSGAVRSALNLKDHPDNLNKLVTIKGTTGSKYCGVYGLRSASDYKWGDQGIEPPKPAAPVACLYQDFESSDKIGEYLAAGWKNLDVLGGLSGWYIKTFDNQNYITVSAYLGNATGGPYENWLIAPPVDLDKSPAKTLTFRTQAGYQAENSLLEVYLLDKADFNRAKKTKLEAAIATAPAKGYSSWVQSGTVDLSAFSGVVYIGWRYYSAHGGNGNSTTYCVDNVNIGGASEN